MATDRLVAARPDGEAFRYTGDLRRGGSLGLTDERLLVAREGETVTSVELGSVDSVEFQDLDWFNAVLGLALTGFGAVSAVRTSLVGMAFLAAGLASLYLTYRKRISVTVKIHNRAKPLTVYPADGSGFYDAFGDVLEAYRERVGESEAGEE